MGGDSLSGADVVWRASAREDCVQLAFVHGAHAQLAFPSGVVSIQLDELGVLTEGSLERLAAHPTGLSGDRIERQRLQMVVAHGVTQRCRQRLALALDAGKSKTIEAGRIGRQTARPRAADPGPHPACHLSVAVAELGRSSTRSARRIPGGVGRNE